jgi:peptide/nickel transport system substrate-binding protein
VIDLSSEQKEKEFRIKGSNKILTILNNFSATEKVIFGLLCIVLLVSAIALVTMVNESFLVPVPTQGGQLDEGVVGLPRLVNPVLAFGNTDQDLTALIYSSLMKYENGVLVPDLAESYTISPDGLTYIFTIKPDARFQDGTPVTAADVIFTVGEIQNAPLKSPQGANWTGITATALSANQVEFTLKQPYAPFLSNTTIGILPKHIWNNVSTDEFIFSQYNIQPIGSGPYKLASITRDSGGIPTAYTLVPFDDYEGGTAYISKIVIHFYADEKTAVNAYESGAIQSIAGLDPTDTAHIVSTSPKARLIVSTLPRIFGVFFNQNQQPILADSAVRSALNVALNKNAIVNQAEGGYGTAINSPIPVGALAADSNSTISSPTSSTTAKTMSAASSSIPFNPNGNPSLAKSILIQDGWTLNAQNVFYKYAKTTGTTTLSFSISTADSPDLKQIANMIRDEWATIGVQVKINVFEPGDLNQSVIVPRKYDALLFGESVGWNLDLYPFWHSSQRNAPGFNIAMYVNSKADQLLTDARSNLDPNVRAQDYAAFDTIIQNDVPAAFIYSPDFMYIMPKDIKGTETVNPINNADDRWNGVSKWYITTDNIWKFFAR